MDLKLNCVHYKNFAALLLFKTFKARFKRRATAVSNSIDRIKFDFSTAVALLGFKRRATAVPIACEQQTYFRSSLLSLRKIFSEGEKRRQEMRLLFAGYRVELKYIRIHLKVS